MNPVVAWAMVIFSVIMFFIIYSLVPSPLILMIFAIFLVIGWVSGNRYMDALEERERQDDYYKNLEKRIQELEEQSNEQKENK
ncbi:hypothetical protein 000TH008_39 [Bacillus phage 000TH008]|nr:hypothetical protein 000TH008_39 [Bacillus phage 000TH008]QQO40733.1 hypothetical protein 000TH009_39 [Bacillus phage 000TH009]